MKQIKLFFLEGESPTLNLKVDESLFNRRKNQGQQLPRTTITTKMCVWWNWLGNTWMFHLYYSRQRGFKPAPDNAGIYLVLLHDNHRSLGHLGMHTSHEPYSPNCQTYIWICWSSHWNSHTKRGEFMGHTAPCLIAIYIIGCGDSDIKTTICLTKSLQALLLTFYLCKYLIWYFTKGLEGVHEGFE